jgi:hypothetical protein
MHYLKTVVLECGNEREDNLATVAPEIADALEEFFTWHPNQGEVDYQLWRMFFNASRYDMEKNDTSVYFEDYGKLKEGLVDLARRLRSHYGREGMAA